MKRIVRTLLAAAAVALPLAAAQSDPAQLAATTRAFFEAMNAGDVDAWLATLAPDVAAFEPVGAPPNEGHEALRAWFEGSRAAFASVSIVVHELFVAGDSVASRWTTTFTSPEGAELTLDGIDVHRFDEMGRIRTVLGYFDPSPLMAPSDSGSAP